MANYRPKYVSFDCYGTLINFEIASVTKRIVGDQVADQDWPVFLRSFSKYRYDQVVGEYYPYQEVLQDAFDRVCKKWNIGSDPTAGKQFAEAGTSFLDVSVPRLGAPFHRVFTAEQAGCYKPRYQAFEYMVEQLDASPADFLHVSSHTRYDLMPAHDLGFRNLVLLDRGYDPPAHAYEYVDVASLAELNQMLGIG